MDSGIYDPFGPQWLDGGPNCLQSQKNCINEFGQSSKSKKSRGNLPKEAVDYLMAWLYENRFRAYPCEETKKRMARDTGLTLQQVNNWYINARRRILPSLITKEGKEPRDYRITRKRTSASVTATSMHNPAYFNTGTPLITTPKDSLNKPYTSTLLNQQIPLKSGSTYSPVAVDRQVFPSIESIFTVSSTVTTSTLSPLAQPSLPRPPWASDTVLPHLCSHFSEATPRNYKELFTNEVPCQASCRSPRPSSGAAGNRCTVQPQTEPLSTLHHPSLYNNYNLVYNTDGSCSEHYPRMENIFQTRSRAKDGNFRILEFNMI